MIRIFSRNSFLKTLAHIYQILMIFLSFTIMFLSIGDLFFAFSDKTIHFINRFDWIVMGIFIIDLLTNLTLAKDKKQFIKVSIIEIIIITPFTVLLKVPDLLKETVGITIPKVSGSLYMGKYPRLQGFINILLSQKFILGSISFIMKPSVTRAAKFFNLSRNYLNKSKHKKK